MASGTWPPRVFLRRFLRANEPYDYVRVVVGLVLLTAAAFKIHELLTRPISTSVGTGLFAARWFQVALVEVELFIGVSLLLKLWRRFTWAATVALFGVFMIYSFAMFVRGSESCGCFGVAAVHPAWTLLLDACLVVVLIILRPADVRLVLRQTTDSIVKMVELEHTGHSCRTVRRIVPVSCMLFVMIVGIWLSMYLPTTAEGGWLDPTQWPGKPLPHLMDSGMPNELLDGQWLVLIGDAKCPACTQLKATLLDLAQSAGGSPRMAFLSLGSLLPSDGAGSALLEVDISSIRSKWRLSAPVVVYVDNGIIIDALSDLEDLEMLRQLLPG
jgi:hypothetical protein